MAGLDDPRALVGTWQLARRIDDRHDGDTGTVDGTLDLAVDGNDLTWHEQGTWHRQSRDVPVTRDLRLTQEPDGWWVRFADGKPFHPWRPGVAVDHPCGADLYRGAVEPGTDGSWTITWDVSGPAKDYTMRTTLRRP